MLFGFSEGVGGAVRRADGKVQQQKAITARKGL